MSAGAWRYGNVTGYTSVGAGSSVVAVAIIVCRKLPGID
jgi:hypothetical protein